MTTLVVGASGATGRLLVADLLARGQTVRIVVRSRESLPEALKTHANLSVIQASLLDLSDADLARHVQGCRAVVSCLGHNLTFRGIHGQPRRLVADLTRRLCDAIRTNAPDEPVRFVLMNTTGNSNRDLDERVSFAQKCVVGLVRLLLPPHVDNEKAADYLRTRVGQSDPMIEWAAVRPDGLTDEPDVTAFDVHPSPTRSAVFNAGVTGRFKMARSMARLINEDDTWHRWKGKMPVISNT